MVARILSGGDDFLHLLLGGAGNLLGGSLCGGLGLSLCLGVEGLHLVVEAGDIGGAGVGLLVEALQVGCLLGLELLLLHALLLQLGLAGFKGGLDVLHVLDGLRVGVGNLAGVVDAADEVLEARGREDDVEHVGLAGAVIGAQAVGQDVLGLLELGLLVGDERLGFGDGLVGGIELRGRCLIGALSLVYLLVETVELLRGGGVAGLRVGECGQGRGACLGMGRLGSHAHSQPCHGDAEGEGQHGHAGYVCAELHGVDLSSID